VVEGKGSGHSGRKKQKTAKEHQGGLSRVVATPPGKRKRRNRKDLEVQAGAKKDTSFDTEGSDPRERRGEQWDRLWVEP